MGNVWGEDMRACCQGWPGFFAVLFKASSTSHDRWRSPARLQHAEGAAPGQHQRGSTCAMSVLSSDCLPFVGGQADCYELAAAEQQPRHHHQPSSRRTLHQSQCVASGKLVIMYSPQSGS